MSRILCAISGVEYRCDHFRLYLSSRESHHPIFDVPTPKLLQLAPQWMEGKMSLTESYLLYLALFNSTDLMEFRSPAIMCQDTPSIIAQNMEPLVKIVERIYNTGSDRVKEIIQLPGFVITPDTKDLTSSSDWIKIWEEAYKNYEDGYRTASLLERMERKESILERWIKDNTKDISQYANRLADWAYDAGRFDLHANYEVLNELDQREEMGHYWKRIIIACAKTESIWNIPDIDLQDLIEHCEEHIYHGTIFAHTLMSLLRAGAQRKKNFLDLGDIDIGANGTTFRILDANASVEDANKLALIDSAPINKPEEKDYPNKLAYIRAKMKWQLAKDYQESQAVMAKIEEINNPVVLNRRASDKKEGE